MDRKTRCKHTQRHLQTERLGPQPSHAVLSGSTILSHDNSNNESVLLGKNTPSPPLTHLTKTKSLNKESCGIVTIKTPHPRLSSSEDRQIFKNKEDPGIFDTRAAKIQITN